MNRLHIGMLRFFKMLGRVSIVLTLMMLLPPILRATTLGTLFFDNMDYYDQSRWIKADGWSNGAPFNVGWRADHITHANSIMTITLDNQPCPDGCSSKPYASGEYRTNDPTGQGNEYYGYGCFEARLKAAAGSGVVTSFFTYNGPLDTPPSGNGKHNEIDIEILGKDTTKMQVNYFTNDIGGHEYMVDLGFDAAADFHDYAFQWTGIGVQWFVDGGLVYSVANTIGNPTPNSTPANGGPQKILMNLWTCTDPGWCDPFTYTVPIRAQYDWVRYQTGSGCYRTYLPLVLKQLPPVVIEDYEDISDWTNLQGDLDHFDQSTDAAQGTFAMRIGGREDNGYTWVGAASTANWGARPRDWREYSTLQVWIKRGETQRGAVPQLTFILSDNDGKEAYLHRDGDTCLNWGGGGWRTPIENSNWQLYVLPLRQTNPNNCYYATNLDWTQVSILTIEVRTPLDHADPDDVYLDMMGLTR